MAEETNGTRRKRLVILAVLVLVVLGVVGGVVGWLVSRNSSRSSALQGQDDIVMTLEYTQPLVGSGQGSLLRIYSKLVSEESMQFFVGVSSGVSSDVSLPARVDLIWTNNLFLEFDTSRQEQYERTTNSVIMEDVDSALLIQEPLQLPDGIIPTNFGAILLQDTASTWKAFALYDTDLQQSIYPTRKTQLERTTLEYDISGTIEIGGHVRIEDQVPQDVPVLLFRNIRMEPQPPALFLYLTTRRAWLRFDANDVFVYVPGAAELDPTLPDGSFALQGTHRFDWTATSGNMLRTTYLQEDKPAFWYLWCEIFTITLAGGELLAPGVRPSATDPPVEANGP